jgi:hypothetical protein
MGKNEWRWIAENPISSVRRPKGGKARDRLISNDEINRIVSTSPAPSRNEHPNNLK